MKNYLTGFDIGTDSISAVVMNEGHQIVEALEPVYHFGNPAHALIDVFGEITGKFGRDAVVSAAFTGSCGETIAQQLAAPFFHDTITIPAGLNAIKSGAGYIFHIGAKDSYFFDFERLTTKGGEKVFVADHGTSTKCGGGSGILITKQCRRFFEKEVPLGLSTNPSENRKEMRKRLGQIFLRAEKEIASADKEIDVGGRCGVVIQSDMIHLQNSGETVDNILSGLYRRVIANYKSDVLKTRQFDVTKSAVATGGVFSSSHLLKTLETSVGLKVERPEYFRHVGAIGAVCKSGASRATISINVLNEISSHEKQAVKTVGPISQYLANVTIHDEKEPVHLEKDLRVFCSKNNKSRDVILGIDGGSTTTKAVLADAAEFEILAEICLYTNGKPLETIQSIFKDIDSFFGSNINILAVAYTGSSGAFYHRLFTKNETAVTPHQSLDIVKDEITCHALGVRHFNTRVDTIFELGGQDAKFTLFNGNGGVKKSKMNLSCMAGTGQTMQNMVEMIGLDLNSSFHDAALAAERTPVVDDTCGVFTEAGIAKLIALGFSKNEIAAAITYGFMGGYVNKFIGSERFGEFASAQGGPFNGKACLAALAMHTNMNINALPHRQLFGAIGAAIAAHNRLQKFKKENRQPVCQFRGLDIADKKFKKEEKHCRTTIDDSCTIKDCKLNVYTISGEKIISGGACPKGNSGQKTKKAPDYVAIYKTILNKHLAKYSTAIDDAVAKERILIPKSLTFLNQQGVFYTSLYHYLGFQVALSPESTGEISDLGIRYAHSEACYPVKLAHGHVAFLKKHMIKGRDKLLLVNPIGSEKNKYKFCPYISGAGFLTKDAVDLANDDVLLPVIHFDDPDHPIQMSLLTDLQRVYGDKFSHQQIDKAVALAKQAEASFRTEIISTGEKITKKIIALRKPVFVGIGRGYTLFDDKASSAVSNLFSSQGLHFVPSAFLEKPLYDIDAISPNMYWVQGREIIGRTLDAALNNHFFPIRITNFNCGSDSILLFHEEKIMSKATKPHLVLQTDGHNNNAQFGTRILANYEIVKNYVPKSLNTSAFSQTVQPAVLKNKIIGIPYMGDNSHIFAATFEALGFTAEVIPTQTKQAQELARKINGTNICMPFSYQVGDCLAWLYNFSSNNGDPNKNAVIIEPMAKGPCRFGQYHVLLKKILTDNNFDDVIVCSPDAERDYTNFPLTHKQIAFQAMHFFKGSFCLDILHESLLRVRPYEKQKGAADAVYSTYFNRLTKMVKSRARTQKFLGLIKKAKTEFENLIDPSVERKPIVAITGEIFVRLHPEANSHSIEMLEKYGLEVRLSPLSQWMEYTNAESIKKFKMTGAWSKYLRSVLKRNYMQSRRKKFYQPFDTLLKERKPHDLHHILDNIQKELVFDKKIEGESPISIGEAWLFANEKLPDISGIFHVGPFGCMQETVATSQINSITRQQRNTTKSAEGKIIPYMDAVFGDSELSNIEAEIAAFSEKCYLKKSLSML